MAIATEKLKNHDDLVKHANDIAVQEAMRCGSTQSRDYIENMINQLQDDFIDDTVNAPPKINESMFYGITGEVAKEAALGTDINPVAAGLSFLSFLGANIGRDVFFPFANDKHHPRIFTIHIGITGAGRKGASQALVKKISGAINEKEPGLLCPVHSGGLSTKEGIAKALHDGHGESEAIHDKRLWVRENEFSSIIKNSRKDTNTLSEGICNLWDGESINPLAMSNKFGVEKPHVGIHANITDFLFKESLTMSDAQSGFINRFIICFAEKIGSVSRPKETEKRVVDRFVDSVSDVLIFAKGDYPDKSDSRKMDFSESAWRYWDMVYEELDNLSGNYFVDGMLQRRHMQLLRLSMIFALTDKTLIIEEQHLKAAYSWIIYWQDSVKFLFGNRSETKRQTEIKKIASKILSDLKLSSKGLTLTEISKICFNKNESAEKIKEAISHLLSRNPPPIVQIKQSKPGPGRPAIIYKDTDKLNNPQSHASRGFEQGGIITEELRKNSAGKSKFELIRIYSVVGKTVFSPVMTRPAELFNYSVPISKKHGDVAKEKSHSGSQKTKVARKKI